MGSAQPETLMRASFLEMPRSIHSQPTSPALTRPIRPLSRSFHTSILDTTRQTHQPHNHFLLNQTISIWNNTLNQLFHNGTYKPTPPRNSSYQTNTNTTTTSPHPPSTTSITTNSNTSLPVRLPRQLPRRQRQHNRAPRLSQTPRRPSNRHPPPRRRRPRRQSRQCSSVQHSRRGRRRQQLDDAQALHRREPRSQGRPVRRHGAEHWVYYQCCCAA